MASYNLLTNVTLKAIREPGLHLDGRGLYVRVDQAGGRFWVLIFKFRGRRREMGLGSLIDVDLKEARHRADDARRLLRDGIDPIEMRREERAADIAPCDQIELTCACGHKVGPAWALWPKQARRTPIKVLRPSLRCQSCGRRGPGVTISSYAGGGAGMRVIWRWPRD